MTDKKLSRVPMNLLSATIYARNVEPLSGARKQVIQGKKYYELRNIATEDGVIQKMVEVDYPITPDYVKSFEQSANYKNDLETARNMQPSGTNLGDITALQELVKMEKSAVDELVNRLSNAEKILASQKQVQGQESEVKDNVK